MCHLPEMMNFGVVKCALNQKGESPDIVGMSRLSFCDPVVETAINSNGALLRRDRM